MGTITALEIQKRNKERVNVYLDGEYAFSLALIEAAKLRKGQPLTDAEIDALRGEDDVTRAVDYAANFLSYRPRSVAEVRRNLEKKDLSEVVIEQAIDRLQQLGYVDDVAFARYWLENRDTFKPRGPAALRYELRQKGVADDIIGEALEALDPVDAARRAGEAKARRLRGLTRDTFRNKLGSFLQRRGFRYETTRDVIHQIMDELVADDPDFFVEDETI
jgi:regulatory protein